MTGGVTTVTERRARVRAALATGIDERSATPRPHGSTRRALDLPPLAAGRLLRSARVRTLTRHALHLAVAIALILLIVAAELAAMWLLLS